MRRLICVLMLIPVLCFAEDEEKKDFHIIPLLNYDFVSVENQQYHSAGGGLMFMKGARAPSAKTEKEPDSLMIAAFYNSHFFMEQQDGYSNMYHNISLFAEKKIRRHQIFGVVNSSSSEPVYGGLQTFQAIIGYGYELIRKDSISLTVGGGLGIISIDIGSFSLPVVPFPFARFSFTSSMIKISVNCMPIPELGIVIAPESRIRMNSSFRIMRFRDIQDFIFECTLWYRFFAKGHKMGDFAGIGLGIKNNNKSFSFGEKDKSYEMGYYSVFGKIDLSFLNVSGGYIFSSRERYDDKVAQSLGRGYFISAQLAWRF